MLDEFLSGLRSCGVGGGARLGLAVSGGADSTALMHLAVAAAPRMDLRLHVFHVDHVLRPGSHEDAGAVASGADELWIPWSVLRVPVRRRPRTSIEAEARDVRYRALDLAAVETGCDHVATAHTLDDQAETVVLRALRGTGVGGLAGIAPTRGVFVRPLLGVRRQALREWLAEAGISWREDPTNADLSHDRNWVRHSVMPLLEERRKGVALTLARLSDLAREDSCLLDGMASEGFERLTVVRDGVLLVSDAALEEPPPIASRIVRRALRHSGARDDAQTVHAVVSLLRSAPGTALVCGGERSVWRLPEGIAFAPRTLGSPDRAPLPATGTVELAEWGVRVRVGTPGTGAPWSWRCTLDASAGTKLVLRGRLPGDRVPTARGTRKVQDVLVDAKVPRFARDRIPVLEAGGRPVAVVGFTTPPAHREPAIAVDVEPLRELWWTASGS